MIMWHLKLLNPVLELLLGKDWRVCKTVPCLGNLHSKNHTEQILKINTKVRKTNI